MSLINIIIKNNYLSCEDIIFEQENDILELKQEKTKEKEEIKKEEEKLNKINNEKYPSHKIIYSWMILCFFILFIIIKYKKQQEAQNTTKRFENITENGVQSIEEIKEDQNLFINTIKEFFQNINEQSNLYSLISKDYDNLENYKKQIDNMKKLKLSEQEKIDAELIIKKIFIYKLLIKNKKYIENSILTKEEYININKIFDINNLIYDMFQNLPSIFNEKTIKKKDLFVKQDYINIVQEFQDMIINLANKISKIHNFMLETNEDDYREYINIFKFQNNNIKTIINNFDKFIKDLNIIKNDKNNISASCLAEFNQNSQFKLCCISRTFRGFLTPREDNSYYKYFGNLNLTVIEIFIKYIETYKLRLEYLSDINKEYDSSEYIYEIFQKTYKKTY